MLKVQICLPVYNEIHPGTVRGIRACLQSPVALGVDFHLSMIQSSNICHARNFLLNEDRSFKYRQEPLEGFDYFLFVDSDISFTLADAMKLLSHRAPVVSGLYFEKSEPMKSVAGFWELDEKSEPIRGKKGDTLAAGIKGAVEVDYVGAGFLLIARQVLGELHYPWFNQVPCTVPGTAEELPIGEDMGFCIGCNEAGIPILCDMDAKLGHHISRLTDYFDALHYLSRVKLGREVEAPVAGW